MYNYIKYYLYNNYPFLILKTSNVHFPHFLLSYFLIDTEVPFY